MRPAAAGTVAGQTEPFDQIVDVRQMVEDLAVAEDDESPSGDAAEQLEQPPVARPVDAGGPHDDQLDADAAAASRARRSPSSLVTW